MPRKCTAVLSDQAQARWWQDTILTNKKTETESTEYDAERKASKETRGVDTPCVPLSCVFLSYLFLSCVFLCLVCSCTQHATVSSHGHVLVPCIPVCFYPCVFLCLLCSCTQHDTTSSYGHVPVSCVFPSMCVPVFCAFLRPVCSCPISLLHAASAVFLV